jgi:outer membrane receptor protein involved in Fe transport
MKRFISLIIFYSILINVSFAQQNESRLRGNISGKVVDAQFREPLEYTNIILYTHKDSTQITGTITDKNGRFDLKNIKTGNYDLEFIFLGFETKRVKNIRITPSNLDISLGTVYLTQTSLNLSAVEVEGERAPVSYQIDKKVINVDQQYSTLSGSAVDVLEKVPSVSVDIEGNVSLRGSGSFRVLIDGRPTVLDPSDALDQIPASTIDNIEIITNPSAKYDPEGTAGIINVILKKSNKTGQSGLANLNVGLNDKYGGDMLYEIKNNYFDTVLGVDYNHRFHTGETRTENITSRDNITSNIFSQGDTKHGRISKGLRGSVNLRLSTRDNLTLNGRYGDRSHQSTADLNYREWQNQADNSFSYLSTTGRERAAHFYQLNTSYLHLFRGKGHQLSSEFSYDSDDSDENTDNELISGRGQIISGKKTTEAGPGQEYRLKLDYTYPHFEKNKFEAGFQSEFNQSEENTTLQEFNTDLGQYELLPQYSNSTVYKRNIHAVYAIYAGEWNKFGYQAGLRGEYTDRAIEFSGVNDRFTIDRWDYFPTLHSSYQLPGGFQVMASYTRRIERPHGWELEPFQTWRDAYNVRVGNPALKPEYINSFETGIQTTFGKSLFSTEVYYRETYNKIERVQSVYGDNITLHSVENIGKDYSLGSELLLNTDINKYWNLNLLGNLYNYRVVGVLLGDNFSRQSFNWSSRFSNTFKIGKSFQFQLDGNYRSPTVSSQGRRKGFFVTSAAVRYEFLEKKLSATLQVRDLFGTARYEYSSSGPDFYNYRYGTREAPMVMLNIRFNINNYKQDRRQEQNRDNGEEPEDF